MKKNLVFVTATEAGILVGVKTKLSGEELAKVKQNEERVNKLLEDVHAVIVFIEPSVDDFNFAIGSYSSGEMSTEAIQVEASNMKSAMDQFKDWLKTVPAVKEDKKELDKDIAPGESEDNTKKVADEAFKSITEAIPDAGVFMTIFDPKSGSLRIAGNLDERFVLSMLLTNG